MRAVDLRPLASAPSSLRDPYGLPGFGFIPRKDSPTKPSCCGRDICGRNPVSASRNAQDTGLSRTPTAEGMLRHGSVNARITTERDPCQTSGETGRHNFPGARYCRVHWVRPVPRRLSRRAQTLPRRRPKSPRRRSITMIIRTVTSAATNASSSSRRTPARSSMARFQRSKRDPRVDKDRSVIVRVSAHSVEVGGGAV